MSGFIAFCILCGVTVCSEDASYGHYCDETADGPNPECDHGDPEDHNDFIPEMPKHDEDFLEDFCVLTNQGSLSPRLEMITEPPSPLYFDVPDTPENRQLYPDAPLYQNSITNEWRLSIEYCTLFFRKKPKRYRKPGFLLHTVCGNILMKALKKNHVDPKDVFLWLLPRVSRRTNLLRGKPYGVVSEKKLHKECGFWLETDDNENSFDTWVTTRPDFLPELPLINQREPQPDMESRSLFPFPPEITILILDLLDETDLLAVQLLNKRIRNWLLAPVCRSIWKSLCSRYGLIPDDASTQGSVDWHKYFISCKKSRNARNRVRIMNVVDLIVGGVGRSGEDERRDVRSKYAAYLS